MASFIDLIKSSEDLLKSCLQLCVNIETDFINDEVTNESKDHKLNEMMEMFKKVKSNIIFAKKKRIRKKVILNNDNIDIIKNSNVKVLLVDIVDRTVNATENANHIEGDLGLSDLSDINDETLNSTDHFDEEMSEGCYSKAENNANFLESVELDTEDCYIVLPNSTKTNVILNKEKNKLNIYSKYEMKKCFVVLEDMYTVNSTVCVEDNASDYLILIDDDIDATNFTKINAVQYKDRHISQIFQSYDILRDNQEMSNKIIDIDLHGNNVDANESDIILLDDCISTPILNNDCIVESNISQMNVSCIGLEDNIDTAINSKKYHSHDDCEIIPNEIEEKHTNIIESVCLLEEGSNSDNELLSKCVESPFNGNKGNMECLNTDMDKNLNIDYQIEKTDRKLSNLQQCYVILDDIVKSGYKTISDESYFKNLEIEVNRLGYIPKFKNKKSLDNDQIKKIKMKTKKLNTFVSLSSKSGSSDNLSDIEESDYRSNIFTTNTINVDSPLSSTDSKESSHTSKIILESKISNGKRCLSDNLFGIDFSQSLKIPTVSNSKASKKNIQCNDKKKTTTNDSDVSEENVVFLSSDSENESNASASDIRINNSNKRRHGSKLNKSNKKQKVNECCKDIPEKRKIIRKIMNQSQLSYETKAAEQQEIERRRRMEEKQKIYNDIIPNKYISCENNMPSIIIEKDNNGDSIVEVHRYISEKLKPHQIEAVHFMYECVIENVQCLLNYQEKDEEEKSFAIGGCVIAHCMGLGKTLSLIAFMHTMLTTPILNLNSCIIVCPVNTALNWKKEWEMWMPPDRPARIFEVCSNEYKKSKVTIVKDWYKEGGVLIIGYEMFRLLATGDSRTISNKVIREKMQEALLNPGADFIVCDEGHLLKNEKSAISKVINKVRTRCRIVLTGTPLQNRLIEYHSMVNFVKPNLLGTQKEFLNRFVNPINNGQHINSTPYDVKIMKKRSHILFKTLDGCVHRRDYSALVKYLPPKYEYVIKIRLSEIQIKLYKIYLSNIQINRHNLFQDQNTLARIWTHPFIICMHQEILDKRMFLAESDEESFINDSADDSIENYKIKHNKCYYESNFVNLISDESDKNSNETDKKVVNGVYNDEEIDSYCNNEEVVKTYKTRLNEQNKWESNKDNLNFSFELENLKENNNSDKHWWSEIIDQKYEYQIEISGKLTILFQILRKASDIGDKILIFSHSLLVLDIIEKYLLQLHLVSGEKVNRDFQTVNESLSDARLADINGAGNGASKYFSEIGYTTWEKGIDYDRMDGSTQIYTRADIQARFNSEKESRLRLFLISTRAGGMGVNLVAANRIVIFDVSWNPSNDIQAIFRSYRFGQNKPVYIYRLVSQGTMEEKMYERQVTKQSLSLRVIDEQQIGRYFTEEDLKSLYKFEPDVYNSDNERQTPLLPKDILLAELITEFPQWIYGYHEHDSLLKNKEGEELTEAERQEAWKEFEEEKCRGSASVINLPIPTYLDYNQFSLAQINYMRDKYPQFAVLFSENLTNLLRYTITKYPDIQFNPSELSHKIHNLFFLSIQRHNSNVAQSSESLDNLPPDDITCIMTSFGES